MEKIVNITEFSDLDLIKYLIKKMLEDEIAQDFIKVYYMIDNIYRGEK